MSDDVIVKWQNSYSVGIGLIDKHHMKLIDLTNKLFDGCMSGNERAVCNNVFLEVLHEVVDYVNYHFSAEEKVMERINYPEYKAHKYQHETFIREVLNKADEFNSSKINTPLSFVHYLRDWILRHIAVTDKKLGKYLLDIKERGDLQQIVLREKRDAETKKVWFE